MKTFLQIFCLFILSSVPLMLHAQSKSSVSNSRGIAIPSQRQDAIAQESFHPGPTSQLEEINNFPASALSALVTVPNATPIGISGKWYTQGVHGLHNIQVDPDHPNNIHAVVMTAINVKPTDTMGANTTSFPQRKVYYTFSSDGGVTWKTPKPLSTTRSGYPDMILYKRNGNYVPIIVDHHFTSAAVSDLFCSVYIESGAPGDGNFKVGDCDRTAFSGVGHDIIWPEISISSDNKTLYVIASVSRTSPKVGDPYDYIQFGTFAVGTDGTPSAWSGWQKGPATSDNTGWATGGDYAIKTSAAGKIGIVWQNYDFATPDLGVYFSESTDGGKTWGDPAISVYTSATTSRQDPSSSGTYYLRASGGLDMFYKGEVANVIFAGYYDQELESNDHYYPATGSIFYWTKGMTQPILVIAKQYKDNGFGTPLDTAADIGINPQNYDAELNNPNIEGSTIARSSDPNNWSIYFDGWVQDDTSAPYQARNYNNTADTTKKLTFQSIYRISTVDGGNTWMTPAPVKVNDLSLPPEQHIDYRFPEVSSWNPISGGNFVSNLLFAADSAAGNWVSPRDPGFDILSWYYAKDILSVNSVKSSAGESSLNLSQNFPNPFISSTTIPLVMKNDDVVTLSVTDILGREVAMLYHGRLSAGEHRIPFNAPNLGAGIYTYTLKTSTGNISRTMSLVK